MPGIRIWMALALLATVPLAPAQKKKNEPETRTVQGAVASATDTAVNGAIVQLKNTKTLEIRSFITQEDGRYHFNGLNPDIDYELKASYQGASSSIKKLSSFDSRKDATINLKLEKK